MNHVCLAELAHGRFYALGTFSLWSGGYPGPDRKVDKVQLWVKTSLGGPGWKLVFRQTVPGRWRKGQLSSCMVQSYHPTVLLGLGSGGRAGRGGRSDRCCPGGRAGRSDGGDGSGSRGRAGLGDRGGPGACAGGAGAGRVVLVEVVLVEVVLVEVVVVEVVVVEVVVVEVVVVVVVVVCGVCRNENYVDN